MLQGVFLGLVPMLEAFAEAVVPRLSTFLLEEETLFLDLDWKRFFTIRIDSHGLLDLLERAEFRVTINQKDLVVIVF